MSKNKNRQAATSVASTENQPTETTLVVSTTHQPQNETIETTVEVVDEPREKKVMSIKEIMDKHARISKCLEKRESIDEASKTLDSFNFGSSKIKDVLIIKDGRGNTFETSKTDLIEDVISLLKNRVEVKTAEVEAELLELETA